MDLAVINEPIAVSALLLGQRDFYEAEKAIWGKTAAVIYTGAVTFFAIVISLYGICAQFRISYTSAAVLLVPGIGLPISSLLYFLLPKWIGKWRYRQYEKNRCQQRVIVFYQDRFEILEDDIVGESCLYGDIGRIVISENLYIIILHDLTCIPIRHAAISQEDWKVIGLCINRARNGSGKAL